MGTLNPHGWSLIIADNIRWLKEQPESHERDHMIMIMEHEQIFKPLYESCLKKQREERMRNAH